LPKRIELRNFGVTSTGGGKSISVRSATALPSLSAELFDYPTPSKKMIVAAPPTATYSNCQNGIELGNFRITSTGGGKAFAAQLLCHR